jgi:hypothetical protein
MVHSLFEFSIRIPISGFCQGQIECERVFFEIESPDRRTAMGFKPLSSAKRMRLETRIWCARRCGEGDGQYICLRMQISGLYGVLLGSLRDKAADGLRVPFRFGSK